MLFSQTLIAWYQIHKRDLPWRGTSNAYHIWLSEIIMQQTRVEQGTSYYLAFVNAFPEPKHLAKAPLDQVLKLWQGLGYYSRARNLHEAAKSIVIDHKGKFPEDYESILRLKGVGEYTASAIASFAFNQPYAVVDGNVYRLLSRVFGVETPIDSSAGKKEFRELAASLIDRENPGTYNQAIMEFGSQHCKPLNPDCDRCVFASICVAREKKKVALLPVKANKTKVRNRYFQYLVIHYKDKTWLRKRTEKDIWQGLYDFPLIESDQEWDEKTLRKSKDWKEMFGNNETLVMEESHTYKHILSHQRIYARFWTVHVSKQMKQNDWTETSRSRLGVFAVPRLVDLFLNERSESESI
jgi:A/G-specific adenine glycosylase